MSAWLIFGDSHLESVRWAAAQGRLDWPAKFVEVGGATAVGLRNPHSKTNALEIFAGALLPARAAVPVMHIGEVDCGFVIWWRAKTLGEPVRVQLEQSLQAHLAFVDRVLEDYPTMVLTGATLPTIRDGLDWGEVANARREVEVPLAERTALTLEYNAALKDAADARALPYIDLSPQLLDGVVLDDRFRHPNPQNHHLDPEAAGPLWAQALNGVSSALEANAGARRLT